MEKNRNKIFLGGTCAETTWRDELIVVLQVPYFNPVVEDWTPECQQKEEFEKAEKCNIHLYVITSAMTGVFSIAEVIESSCTPGKITIFHIIPGGFDEAQLRSLKAVAGMVVKHGGISYISGELNRTARVINNCFKMDTDGFE